MNIFASLAAMPGEVSMYYRTLSGSRSLSYFPDRPVYAASLIKLFIMGAAFEAFHSGALRRDRPVQCDPAAALPSCGALNLLSESRTFSAIELVRLMIALSDNTATNLLIDLVGIDAVNRFISGCGVSGTVLRKKLYTYSTVPARNTVTARACSDLLTRMWGGRAVGLAESAEMIEILKSQRLNGKIPFFLPDGIAAHKTGEDDGVTHDVGIVYAQEPFVVCFLSQNTDVPRFERLMQDITRELAAADNQISAPRI